MSSTQRRSVFVGNIPYDATEEELIRICEEVGPVVSFRLVLDRDTGKPKGFGFCEYRDEETALSARRNLQGYEINGRQLRVDFAENEKGSADRSREQGRGGPGFVDLSKQAVGPKVGRDLSLHQAVGITAAVSAAGVMAGLLGAPQMPIRSNATGGAGRVPMTDPLTAYLAGLSRFHLYEIIHLMKEFIQQNQQQAREILLANPHFTKALFQAQLILGSVPQMGGQVSSMITPQQGKTQLNALQMSSMVPSEQGKPQMNATGQLQPGAQQPQPQLQHTQNFPFQMTHHSPQQQLSIRPTTELTPQSALVQVPPSTVGLPQHTQLQLPLQPPLPPQARPPSPLRGAQGTGSQYSQTQQPQLSQQPSGITPPLAGLPPYQGMPPPLPNQPPPQHLQVSASLSLGGVPQSGRGLDMDMFSNSAQFASSSSSMGPPLMQGTTGEGASGIMHPQEYSHTMIQPLSQQQTQISLEPDQQKALLQQVMNLTPEQINYLPPEQRQQVLDLQQAFRNQIF